MSLDASGKIYGYRVDAVHQDVVRLISGIGGQKNGQGPDIPEAPENLLEVRLNCPTHWKFSDPHNETC